ncbi:amino acid adenylation domain-containing protein [Streptomyces sp. SM17]|uniref:non-ribosomal peptide synthetase n=1 Tax=Streptomyces sp. SM17 TaxID=565560 RepID=UPI000CD59407|nr:non-ribosomal peptide synthetase [Streptomyces sp. SM17]AWL35213.1 amino acid adenylation domain-containing protein [Streptomyces sp. SM17]
MNQPSSRDDRIAALPAHLREALAQRLAGRGGGGSAAGSAPPVPRVARDGELRMSYGQQRLWFLEDFEPGGADYHSALPLRITGRLDTGALRAAVGDLTARHEALRTTFGQRDGVGVQVVHDRLDAEWVTADAGDEATARKTVLAELARPYDLREGPLVRVLLVRLSDDEHLCVLGMHHIVTDGWSMGVVARELGALYTARLQGGPHDLPEVTVQYADFAAWQRGRLEDGGQLDEQLTWWREQLKGIAPLELPTDRPRPAVRDSAGAVRRFTVPAATTAGLRALARQRGASLFMALTAAVKAVLARWSGQRDIALGTSAAARGHKDLEQVVGFLVNTVVLRTDVAPELAFGELLDRVKDTVLDAFAHEDVPFDKLVEALQPERDTSRTPLVQAMVALQDTPADTLALPGAAVSPYPLERDASLFDLTFEFTERDGVLHGLVEYDTDLFDADTVDRLSGHLCVLLDGAVADPARPVAALPLLTEEERRRLAVEWNATELPSRDDALVHERLAAQAARTPDAVALIADDATLTHRELDERANRLAHHLTGLGAGPGSLVGLSLGRGSAMAVGLLGILRAGAAYVPLDPGFPGDRLAYMLADSGARIVVGDSAARASLPLEPGVRFVDLAAEAEVIGRLPATAPPTTVAPHDLAYVIYTSGSTGNPKGVAVEHRNVRHILTAWDERYGLTELKPRFLSVSSLSVDLFFADLIRSVPFGGALVIASKDVTTDPAALLDLIARTGATGLEIVPSLLNAVLQEVERRGEDFPALRLVSVGSEGWRVEDCRNLLRRITPGCVVVNAYGGTEATVDSTVFVPTEESLGATVYVPIGRPLPNTRVYVLDAARNLVPQGVPGEIWIGGEGIARGYHGRPELTAERFTDSPFAGGDRLYRTGDRARWLASGDLEFLGRADDQVKIRGFRIELGEVESALLTHPGVRDAVVLAWLEESGRRRLVAYVVPEDGGSGPRGADLRAHLSGHLPDYMVPAVFVTLDHLPLTPSGKVDRRSLPEPEVDADRLGTGYTAPRDATEEILAAIWAEVLGVSRVGVHDNFFDLGGDSILSIQVVSRARQAGLRLTSRLLFLHQSVAALAAVAAPAEELSAAPEAVVSGRVPLTPIQRWFLDEHTVDPDHYAMSVHLRLAPGTDAALLERALDAVVAHHDALRLRYVRQDGDWVQEYGERPAGLLTVRDLTGSSDPEQELDAAALQAQRALDLSTGTLVKGVFLRGAGASWPRLFLTVHHIVMDGVSWRVLLEDLATAYAHLAEGRQADLGARTSSYQQWAEHLTAHVRDGGLDSEVEHWRAVDARHAPALPADDPAGRNVTAAERTVEVRLDRAETDALLHRVPSVYRTQINDVLVAALGRALGAWTGSKRLVIGLEGHGREELFDDLDLSRTVGWYTTHFPVALTLPDAAGWGETVKSVKEQLRAVPGRGLGYDALRFLSAPGTPGHALRTDPLPPVSFNYLGQWDGTTTEDGLIRDRLPALGQDHAPDEPRPYLLDVVGMVEDGTLGFTWIFSGEVFDRATVERVAGEHLAALRALLAHCQDPSSGGATPSDFPLARLDQAAVDRIAGDGRNIEDVYPLTPMQSGMLFHTLAEPEGGAYFEQMSFRMDGVAAPELLERAWQHVTDHLEILRSAVVWEQVDQPLLVVRRNVTQPVTHLDWRGLSEEEQGRALARHLAEDRELGIDLAAAPMVRIAVARTSDTSVRVVRTSHHVLLDGWSTFQMLDELTRAYRALLAGEHPALPSRRPFGSYVEWLQGQDLTRAEAYWRELLDGFGQPTSLPYDRNPVATHRAQSAERLVTRLPAAASRKLYDFARAERLTVNTVVQGAWALLLSRYAGESDVVFGATVSGRPADLPGVDSVVGMLVNTLPVRVGVDGDTPVGTWLAGVQEAQAEARQYEYVPLPRIQGWSGVERGTSLFDSLVAFENFPVDGDTGDADDGVRLHGLEGADVTNFPLNLVAYAGDELAYALAYDPALFDLATVERMAAHLEALLTGMADAPARPVSAVPMLAEGERERVVREWAGTEGVAPWPGTLHSQVAERASEQPDAVAVVCGEDALTYGELDRSANQLAHHLISLGAGPGHLVGLSVERSTDMAVGLLGIMKTGAAYLPLDPAYPADRLTYMLEDSGARLLITHHHTQPAPAGIQVIDLDVERETLAQQPTTAPSTTVAPDDLAYVIYTSGSTGRPKGVAIEHHTVLHLLANSQPLYGFGPQDVWTVFHSYAFDFSVWELWGALTTGARAVIVPHDTARNPEAMWHLVKQEKVTLLSQTPSMFRELVGQAAETSQSDLPDLRWIVFGGEALEPKHVQPWFDRYPAAPTQLVNMYGITETTVHVTHQVITTDHLAQGGRLPVGRPLPGYQVRLLDPHGNPVPTGVPGEIYVAGNGLARGYLHRPQLTAERFTANPHHTADTSTGTTTGTRMYRSGDLARWLPDGTLEHLGRADDQVKIRGYRIELGEIETALTTHPHIHETLVTTHQDHDGHRRLLAYLVTDTPLTPAQLRTHLAATLPDHMIPALYIPLDRLPLTPSGKVDRRALPQPDTQTEPTNTTEHTPPRTPTEHLLATTWATVLGTEEVGIHDNFFDLGGDSILSIQVISHARRAGLQLTSKLMFTHQTIAELASVVRHAEPETSGGDVAEAVAGSVELTPVQRWFFDGHTTDPDRYAMSVHVALAPDTDPGVLARALEAIVDHHDALRMRYSPDGEGGWAQEYGERPDGLLTVRDIPADGAEAALHDAADEAQRALDLRGGALVKGVFLRTAGADRPPGLFLAVHHLVMDGVSWRILLEDLATAYAQLAEGRPADLGARTSSYQHWARRLTDHVRSGALDHETGYWRKASAGAVDLPCDGPASSTYGEVAAESVVLDRETTEALLHRAPAAFRTQINDVLLGALGRVLNTWAGGPVTVALEGHGREELFDDVDLSRTVGWFTTIYPVTLVVPDGPWGTALKAVRKTLRKVPGRGIGYGALRYLREPDHPDRVALAAAPPPRISFNYLGQWDSADGGRGLVRDRLDALGADQAPGENRPHLIDVVAAVSDGQLRIEWMHAPSAHAPSTVRRLADDFATALRQIAAAAGN